MATKTRLSVEEFLALPETEPPSEYFDGEVVQKVSPGIPHSALAAAISARLLRWAEQVQPAYVGVEGRHIAITRNRVYLPDVHLTMLSRLAGHETENPLTVAPDVAVEILSPDDRPQVVLEKVELYVALEIPLAWFVDPDERTVREYRGGRPSRLYSGSEVIDGAPVLPGFTLDLPGLFSVVPSAE